MIFITVGTAPFPFFRMNDVFMSLLRDRKTREQIVYQHGTTPVAYPHTPRVLVRQYFSYKEMQRYMREARVIISHGGLATVYQAIQLNNKPYVVARQKIFHEHVDDHQVHFTEQLMQKNLIYSLPRDGGYHILNSSNKQNVKVFSNSLKSLCEYLDALVMKDK